MSLIGYARRSKDAQTHNPQRVELRAAGCAIIHEEHASGADRARPALDDFWRRSGHARRW